MERRLVITPATWRRMNDAERMSAKRFVLDCMDRGVMTERESRAECPDVWRMIDRDRKADGSTKSGEVPNA